MIFVLYFTDGPAEEIYGMFRKEYWGSKPIRGFTKFVPRYGKALLGFNDAYCCAVTLILFGHVLLNSG